MVSYSPQHTLPSTLLFESWNPFQINANNKQLLSLSTINSYYIYFDFRDI